MHPNCVDMSDLSVSGDKYGDTSIYKAFGHVSAPHTESEAEADGG